MTPTMVRSVMLTVLMHILLVSHGAKCSQAEDGASLHTYALDLPWKDELCCDSPAGFLNVEGGGMYAPETNGSESNLPHHSHCSFTSLTTEPHPPGPSGTVSSFHSGTCLDILCRIDENWEKLTCDLQSHGQPSTALDPSHMVISLKRLLSQKDDLEMNSGNTSSDSPVICEVDYSFTCSINLDTTTRFVHVSIPDSEALVLLRVPPRPVTPSPPVNLSHIQTIEAELILHWDDPSDTGPLRYEVRYSFNTTHPDWQVVPAPGEPRVSLDLKPALNYTVQVRCSGPTEPPLWSNWSESYHICLGPVTYVPEKVVARPGENVTVYCVFNDHSINASTAEWMLNFHQPLPRSQYHQVNQWVSQITVQPSETQMYDLLQCTQKRTIPYSQIFVEGVSININCETSGDIDALNCSWNITQWTKPEIRSRWSDLTCDVMEERERAGEEVGRMGPECRQVKPSEKSCTIQPLRMNCHKLWLEMSSRFGPIRSKPIYLSPIDHVKPHSPTNVKAVSRSNGVLKVTWQRPSLPVEGVKCQFRYQLPSMGRVQPKWKVERPVLVPWGEVVVPDMCQVYLVQVQCMHVNGLGYWSEWSDSVYSTPENSRAPERGPDFWRILQEDPYRPQTNVVLLFQDLPASKQSYCVDGLIVQHQAPSGAVIREKIDMMSSYSFEWNQELQTVTVEAYNNRGSSTNNINMTLEKQPKRRCVHSFRVVVINSTCVSLSWSLLDNSSVPLFMVVQWLPQKLQESDHHKVQSGKTWARLPYSDRPVYLRGDFFGSEEYGFYLYPVFADGEGEPVFTKPSKGDPAAYMMLMIVSFLSIVLLITLVLSQNQMKKIVWKDVPNPNNCSWAKDFRKADTFDHLFRPPDGLPAWPLLLPSENISKVVIVDKADLTALTTALVQTPLVSLTSDPAAPLASSTSVPSGFDSEVDQTQFGESVVLIGGAPSSAINVDALTSSHPRLNELQPVDSPVDQPPGSANTSAQSSVTYATVLLSNPNQDQQPIHLHYRDGSGSSSSDEGNFSANNSDISGSFPGGLWELDSCRGGEIDDPRRSCSYNSVEELSETSEQEDEGDVRHKKHLYYLGMEHPPEDEESEEEEDEQREEETKTELLKNMVLNREDCCIELHPLLGPEGPSELVEPLSPSTCGFSPLYLPQFRTASCMRQVDDSKPQP